MKAAQAVTSELRLETVLQRLVTELSRLLGSDAADCYFLDADRGVLRCAAVHGLDRGLVGWEASADKGLAGEALRRATAVLRRSYEQLASRSRTPAYEGFARAIVAPMGWAGGGRGSSASVRGTVAGVPQAGRRGRGGVREPRGPRRTERGEFRAEHAPDADPARLLPHRRHPREPLEQAETLPAIAHAATERSVATSRPCSCRGRVGSRPPHPRAPAGGRGRARLPGPALAACAEERRPLSSPTAKTDERLCEALRSTARGTFASLLALPLEHRDAGALVVVFFRNERGFSDDDLEVGRHLAQAARGALERTELYESERTANALSRQLARTGSRLAVELDPDAVIAEVVQQRRRCCRPTRPSLGARRR